MRLLIVQAEIDHPGEISQVLEAVVGRLLPPPPMAELTAPALPSPGPTPLPAEAAPTVDQVETPTRRRTKERGPGRARLVQQITGPAPTPEEDAAKEERKKHGRKNPLMVERQDRPGVTYTINEMAAQLGVRPTSIYASLSAANRMGVTWAACQNVGFRRVDTPAPSEDPHEARPRRRDVSGPIQTHVVGSGSKLPQPREPKVITAQ